MTDISNLATTAENAAVSGLAAATANPTVAGIEGALEKTADTIIQAAASEANPLLGGAVGLFIGPIVHELASAVVQIFVHIGAEIPAELNAQIVKLETHLGITPSA